MNMVTGNARNGVLHKIVYVDDLVQMSESMEDLTRKLSTWKATLESEEMKINTKRKLMVNGT